MARRPGRDALLFQPMPSSASGRVHAFRGLRGLDRGGYFPKNRDRNSITGFCPVILVSSQKNFSAFAAAASFHVLSVPLSFCEESVSSRTLGEPERSSRILISSLKPQHVTKAWEPDQKGGGQHKKPGNHNFNRMYSINILDISDEIWVHISTRVY